MQENNKKILREGISIWNVNLDKTEPIECKVIIDKIGHFKVKFPDETIKGIGFGRDYFETIEEAWKILTNAQHETFCRNLSRLQQLKNSIPEQEEINTMLRKQFDLINNNPKNPHQIKPFECKIN